MPSRSSSPLRCCARVAETYEHGGRHPTRAVQDAEGVAQSTAQLYVKKARERGFITRPAPGRRLVPPDEDPR